MGLISMVWGISSILGPPVGGFIVAWSSWRWIFYINLPIGFLALVGIGIYLRDEGAKKQGASIDFQGALTLTIAVTALLSAFLLAGRNYPWFSIEIIGLFAVFIGAGVLFCYAEKRAKDPILALGFLWKPRFSLANGSAFFSSFAIFSLSAFSPLFIQGVLGKSPAELGVAMVPLTLGWSGGAMMCGQMVTASREKSLSILGSLLLAIGAGLCLALSFPGMPVPLFSGFLAVAGLGMGFVTVPTLLIVQKSLSSSDLGVATSSQQFARTLGGTIGIGISGGLVATSMQRSLSALAGSSQAFPLSVAQRLGENMEALFQPQVQAQLTPGVNASLQAAVGGSVEIVFWSALITSVISLLLCFFLPGPERGTEQIGSEAAVETAE